MRCSGAARFVHDLARPIPPAVVSTPACVSLAGEIHARIPPSRRKRKGIPGGPKNVIKGFMGERT